MVRRPGGTKAAHSERRNPYRVPKPDLPKRSAERSSVKVGHPGKAAPLLRVPNITWPGLAGDHVTGILEVQGYTYPEITEIPKKAERPKDKIRISAHRSMTSSLTPKSGDMSRDR